MYRFALAVVLILAAGWPCGPACADSDVLVPSGNSSAPDDLGYTTQKPAAGQPATDQTNLPVLNPGESSEPAQNPIPAPANVTMQKTPGEQVPAPRIFQLPIMGAESTAANASLPNSMRVHVAEDSRMGISDTSTVYNMLGISTNDVSKHCHLSAGGMANSNGGIGIYTFDTGAESDAVLRYDGKLTAISAQVHAMCDPVPLPASTTHILKVGDDYLVLLSQITCGRPPDNAQSVTVHYEGNGTGKCVYE